MIAIFLFALITSSASQAATTVECKIKKIHYLRNSEAKMLALQFERIPRNELIQSAWAEILKPNKNSVALPLLHYLASTETKSEARGYYKALIRSLYRETQDIDKALKAWPKRPSRVKSPFKLAELCRLYRMARTPASR